MSKSRRSLTALASVVAAPFLLAGCGSDEAASSESGGSQETVEITFEYTAEEGDGGDDPAVKETATVSAPKDPDKVVFFDMGALDTWGALGGEAAGAPLDSVPDYLEEHLASDAFNAGTLFEADLLEVEAQQPDLIIVGGRSSALWPDLNEIAPTVDLTAVGTFEETLQRNAAFLGEVLGEEEKAEEALAEVTEKVEEARRVTADIGPSLGVMASGDQITALAADGEGGGRNRGTLIYDLFGVTPVDVKVEPAVHGDPVSFEFLVETDPDYLFVIDRNAAIGEGMAAEELLDNEIVRTTSASQDGHIVYLDPTAWYIVGNGLTSTQMMADDMLSIADPS